MNDARARPGSPRRDFASLEAALGHAFHDRGVLKRALTHTSAAETSALSNERLEFLGDRVLGLLTAQALLEALPGEAEGGLAPRLNALVRKETCAEVAGELDLGARLFMARSEAQSGGRRKAALLADAVEALMGAVYLDGGLPAARTMFNRFWLPRLERLRSDAAPIDAKTALQEWAQGRGMHPPIYELVGRTGPDHAPEFTVSAVLEDGRRAQAAGASKRAAEQKAAAALLEALHAAAATADREIP